MTVKPVSAPAPAKPYQSSDLIPRNWEGSHDKGYFGNFMSRLRLWMQACACPKRKDACASRQRRQDGQRQLVSGLLCDEVSGIETALHQIVHRTTRNEPLTTYSGCKDKCDTFEVWHPIVRSYDERSTSDKDASVCSVKSATSATWSVQRTWRTLTTS